MARVIAMCRLVAGRPFGATVLQLRLADTPGIHAFAGVSARLSRTTTVLAA
jgi:hypothetical protein